ncbi:transmembrane protein 151B-like [Schistocerca cancellata]|uniref:transmembrane protein 151B-like n=1 Tax=Schistocerca cancellata TaxID=274614 RepID=UPI0021188B7B|nr:transmembrane protein 151B-like [Schistocerca cancellata]
MQAGRSPPTPFVLQQRPEQQGVLCALQRDASWKCLALTLLICGCLGAVTWCRLAEVTKVIINFSLYPITRTRQMSPCEDGYLYVPVAFLALLYLVYLVECWHCTARLDLQGPRAGAAQVLERVRLMKEAQPVVWWKAVCYHYVRRKRQVTRYRHGDAFTSTQVYYERVNSHAAGACFSYSYCGVRDISRELKLDADCPLTKIRFSKGFAFANVEAAAEFEEQRARFFGEYERVDDYLEMREGLDVAHFRDEQLTVAPGVGASLYSPTVFWVCSLLLLSWPLRLLLQCRTAYLHYQVTKLFGVNYETSTTGGRSSVVTAANNNNNNNNNTRSVSCCQQEGGCDQRWLGSRGGLSHCTADSGDLEWCCRDNSVLVPSYSEALLMDTSTGS